MDQYYFTSTYSEAPEIPGEGGLLSGFPAVIDYADNLVKAFPQILAESVNAVLQEHVEDSRELLDRQEEYSGMSQYYDVVQGESPEEFHFGFDYMPDHLKERANALEFGDAFNPPRAFVRRNVFKKVDELGNKISKKVNHRLGESSLDA